MCFSASSSFTAGVLLSAIGIVSIERAEKKFQIYFACIPLIFAVQQISEGFLWLALTDSSFAWLRWPSTYFFLFVAQVIWPFWIPFSVLLLEKENNRKKIEVVLVIIGALISLYLGFCLLTFPVEANIVGMHISYTQDYPAELANYGAAFYSIATIIPPMFSSNKKMWMLGVSVFISYIISAIFYTAYIVSVWCFFASVISAAVFLIILELKKSIVKQEI
jgi:hypothetical protein